jgi:site-specific DNA-methyltransferase (adenine-specific)
MRTRLDSRIIHGDCLAEMAALARTEPQSVDCIITSPPYNWKKNYHGVSDNLPWPEYWALMEAVGRALLDLATEDGVLFLQAGSRGDLPWHSVNIAQCYERAGWVLQKRIVWQKATEDGRGHFTPISSDRFLNFTHEDLFLFSRDGKARIDRLAIGVPYTDATNTTRWKHGRDLRCRGDVWFIPHKTIRSRGKDRDGHTATFPELLVERCLLLMEQGRSLRVLDPFCGRGTVPVVAARRGHEGIGMELSKAISSAAMRNLAKELGAAMGLAG